MLRASKLLLDSFRILSHFAKRNFISDIQRPPNTNLFVLLKNVTYFILFNRDGGQRKIKRPLRF